MPTILQLRRGTAAQNAAYTGATFAGFINGYTGLAGTLHYTTSA